MYKLRYNYNIGKNCENTFPCNQSNAISKDYYNFLIGEINRGFNMQDKAICKTTDNIYGKENYYLISIN